MTIIFKFSEQEMTGKSQAALKKKKIINLSQCLHHLCV